MELLDNGPARWLLLSPTALELNLIPLPHILVPHTSLLPLIFTTLLALLVPPHRG